MNEALRVRPTREGAVSTTEPVTGAGLLDWLAGLVEAHAERTIGPDAADARLLRVSLSRPMHHRGDRHHRVLTAYYRAGGAVRERRIWLKFLSGGRTRYEAQEEVWHKTRGAGDLFPRPYFYGERASLTVIGMEAIEGTSLRTLFVRRALTRRAGTLVPVFSALGRSLRAFHDSFEAALAWKIPMLEHEALGAVAACERLTADQRRRIARHIEAAAVRAGGAGTQLPLVPLHHDCGLRNVLVRSDGSPVFVDLDLLRAPPKPRWYDVAGFMINLESQIKFAPFVGAGSIATGWHSFWDGYMGAGPADGLAPEQVSAVLYLMKIRYLLGIRRRPIRLVYEGALAPRYIGALERSLLSGEHLALRGRRRWRASEWRAPRSARAGSVSAPGANGRRSGG